jgi:hypothetical protein
VAGVLAAALLGFPIVIAVLGLMVGLIAALFGVGLAVAAVAGPWLAFGYLGYRLWRRSARPDPRPTPPYPLVPTPPTPAAASAPLDPAVRLPDQQRAQVERIRRKAEALLARAGRFPAGSHNLYLVRRTLQEYLPATLDAYLALPPGYDAWPVTPDGRTGLQVLNGQLDLLEAKLDEVAADLEQHNVDRLLANERFLEQHFGRRDSELSLLSAEVGELRRSRPGVSPRDSALGI